MPGEAGLVLVVRLREVDLAPGGGGVAAGDRGLVVDEQIALRVPKKRKRKQKKNKSRR